MAATADQIRTVGLLIVEKVDALKAAVDPVATAADAWTLDGADGTLPTAAAVKAQLAAFEALSISAVSATDGLTAIRATV